MRVLLATLALAAFATFAPSADAATGFLKQSWVDGQYRTCVYNSLGREYYVTIKATRVCKLSIKFNEK